MTTDPVNQSTKVTFVPQDTKTPTQTGDLDGRDVTLDKGGLEGGLRDKGVKVNFEQQEAKGDLSDHDVKDAMKSAPKKQKEDWQQIFDFVYKKLQEVIESHIRVFIR